MENADRKLAWAAFFFVVVAVLGGMLTGFEPLYKWQSLIAGMLALAAAWVGGSYLQAQIRSGEQQETRRRDARFLAARATLPLTLSAVSEYATICARAYRSAYRLQSSGSIPQNIGLEHFPELPFESVQEFCALIEYGDEAIRDPIKRLLSLMQVQRARVKGFQAWLNGIGTVTIVTTGNLEDEIINSAEIYARASALYAFGRFTSDKVPAVSSDNIVGALDQLGFFIGQDPNLYERAKGWFPFF